MRQQRCKIGAGGGGHEIARLGLRSRTTNDQRRHVDLRQHARQICIRRNAGVIYGGLCRRRACQREAAFCLWQQAVAAVIIEHARVPLRKRQSRAESFFHLFDRIERGPPAPCRIRFIALITIRRFREDHRIDQHQPAEQAWLQRSGLRDGVAAERVADADDCVLRQCALPQRSHPRQTCAIAAAGSVGCCGHARADPGRCSGSAIAQSPHPSIARGSWRHAQTTAPALRRASRIRTTCPPSTQTRFSMGFRIMRTG